MNNYAIISEFNPFHKGHKYLIDKCRQNDATHITAIMSGNYVQRGDIAVIPKHIRTAMALKNGVDLVIELPLPYAVANAQVFARGGVFIAHAMGCVNHLAFGSECGNVDLLKKACNISTSPVFEELFKAEISKGVSYPVALTNTVKNMGSDLHKIISSPNNVLGIEYIKALNELNSDIQPVTFKREGDAHNSTEITSEFASASNIRKLILNNSDFNRYIPENCREIFDTAITSGSITQLNNNMRGLILKLRQMTVDEISDIADINEGLENRLYNAVCTSIDIDEIIEKVKTKRYTHARIRRLIISCLLGITKNYTTKPPEYIRVLGFNKKGTEILNATKRYSSLPVVTKLTNLPQDITSSAKKMIDLEIKSTDIYNTFSEKIKPCGEEYRNGIVIIK